MGIKLQSLGNKKAFMKRYICKFTDQLFNIQARNFSSNEKLVFFSILLWSFASLKPDSKIQSGKYPYSRQFR